jgi:hypothetical protein
MLRTFIWITLLWVALLRLIVLLRGWISLVDDVCTYHYLVAYCHLINVHCGGAMTVLSGLIIIIAVLSSGFVITITVYITV